ncbi:hypothetical protein L3Q82_000641 [Scortum barcoo]|uniref:Uncharacterized protein n=1 Tax=Scortum barcoo TaxID=214431 RepID=A0ACB8WFH6_9TELE|nr:hypothetical protein L3Q82_000641 [Scortum barcoo]
MLAALAPPLRSILRKKTRTPSATSAPETLLQRTWLEAESDTSAGHEDSERGEKESKDHHIGHSGESGPCWWQRLKADTAHCWIPQKQTKEDATSPDKAFANAHLDEEEDFWSSVLCHAEHPPQEKERKINRKKKQRMQIKKKTKNLSALIVVSTWKKCNS